MISVEKAIQLVKNNTQPLLKETLKTVGKAGGYVLFKDVFSPISMPPFRQSAMDGYALNLHDSLTYILIGEVKAGDSHQPVLKKGEAVRIFTGAPVPDTSNAVMMQEKVSTNGNIIHIEHQIVESINIRPLGEQVKHGDVALKKGTKLNPAAIGYLTSLGITEVSVYKKPAIALITTGNELIEAGKPLSYGKIYESNSTMLQNALYNLKFYDITLHKVEYDYDITKSKLQDVIAQNDLVIVTGGISVGDYDFVGKALLELNTQSVFYKVKQKPGKPLFFGKKDDTLIFCITREPRGSTIMLLCLRIHCFTKNDE